MANPSIYAAFERMWQHIVLALGGKADKTDIAQSDMSQNDETAPDYVKNRTHWVEENVNIALCNYDALEITDECVDVDITEPFILGQSYTIIVNGTTYNLTARYYPIWQCFMIGNDQYYDLGETDGIDSNVPFCIVWYWPDDISAEFYAPIGTYSINISTIRNIYHKFDEGFLPTTIVGRQVSEDGAEIFNDYYKNIATGYMSHAEGETTTASGAWSHAEGNYTFANGQMSHAEGWGSIAEGGRSHAEGYQTDAYGSNSHAEGFESIAIGDNSHAEGFETMAYGKNSHAEGGYDRSPFYYPELTGAAGSVTYQISPWSSNYLKIGKLIFYSANHTCAKIISISESESTITLDKTLDKDNALENAEIDVIFSGAFGKSSHSEGMGTSAHSDYQHAQGKYNVEDLDGKYAHIVGNGTAVNNLSNAHTLDWSGNAWFAGDIKVGGTGQDDANAKTLATTEYVQTEVAGVVNAAPETLNTLNELAAALGDDPNFATTVATQIGNKVDKVDGKGLSTNDYTTAEKNKLDGIASGATANTGTITGVSANGTSVATSGVANIPAASTSKYGVTKLSSSTSSTSTSLAATASAVKSAYDLANTANTAASTAKTTADTASSTASAAQTTANAAMPKSGGTFTGAATAQNNTSYTTKQIRNIYLIAEGETVPSGANGDICLVYVP